MTSYNYIAIDIARESLAVYSEQYNGTVSYDRTGLKKILNLVSQTTAPLVVCEATGGYEKELLSLLRQHGIDLNLVNPARVRAFAKSEGLKAKTDPIDAQMLMRFAQSKQLQPTAAPSAQEEALQELMDRRSQLTESLAREKNRLQKSSKSIRKSIEKMIRFLDKEIADIEKQIKELVDSDQQMREQKDTMISVSGVGETTAWAILAYLHEITIAQRNQIVALAGIAPYNRDSGKFKGKRRIQGGRAKVRKCLYMATQSAANHNPHIKQYVAGLIARGKPYKWAIVAAMRKLLIHLQSLLKKSNFALA
jgi:transposase